MLTSFSRNGPWTEEEKKLFMERYKEFFGKKGVPENTQWYEYLIFMQSFINQLADGQQLT